MKLKFKKKRKLTYKIAFVYEIDIWTKFFKKTKFKKIYRIEPKKFIPRNSNKYYQHRILLYFTFFKKINKKLYKKYILWLKFKTKNFFKSKIYLKKNKYAKFSKMKLYKQKKKFEKTRIRSIRLILDDSLMNLSINVSKFKRKKRNRFFKKKAKFKQISFFYGNIKKKQFNLICLKSKRHRKNSLLYFFKQLESRADLILFRSNFCSSIYTAQHYIKNGQILIQNSLILKKHSKLIDKKKLHFLKKNRIFFFKHLLSRIISKQIIKNPPTYLYINYRLMHCFFISKLMDLSNINLPNNLINPLYSDTRTPSNLREKFKFLY